MSRNKKRHSVSPEKRKLKLERRAKKLQAKDFVFSMAGLFQFLWVMIMVPRVLFYVLAPVPWYFGYLALGLISLAVYNQLRIYYPLFSRYIGRNIPDRLITNGWFRFTRHPMYTLVLLADLVFFLYVPWDWKVTLHTIATYLITIITCYWHEREVLAQYGEPAAEYYSRTPRLLFMYPFRRWTLL